MSSQIEAQTWKEESIKLWTADPCGAVYGESYPIGSKEFFDAVEAYRFNNSPWMTTLIPYDEVARKRVLEVGCGMGLDLVRFAAGGGEVIGIDLTPRHLQLARKRLVLGGQQGYVINTDAEILPFSDNSFDLVYSFGVLHHTPHTQTAVDEIYRVLSPNGEAIVMLYHKHSLRYWLVLIGLFGIWKGELRRYSLDEVLSRHVEYSESDARPLVKVYSKRDARRLFHRFQQVEIQIRELGSTDIPKFGKFIPQRLLDAMAPYWGWFMMIRASKYGSGTDHQKQQYGAVYKKADNGSGFPNRNKV